MYMLTESLCCSSETSASLLSATPQYKMGFPDGSDGKESACNAGDPGSIPGSGRSSGNRNSYPLQYSCPENSMDREALRDIVHGVTNSWT